MKKKILLMLVLPAMMSPAFGQTVTVFGEKIPIAARYDDHSWKHFARGSGIAVSMNVAQEPFARGISPLVTRVASYSFSLAWEAAQGASGQWFDPLDIAFDVAGTELGIFVYGHLFKKKKTKRHEFEHGGKLYRVEIEEVR